jgi:hypothetical protein
VHYSTISDARARTNLSFSQVQADYEGQLRLVLDMLREAKAPSMPSPPPHSAAHAGTPYISSSANTDQPHPAWPFSPVVNDDHRSAALRPSAGGPAAPVGRDDDADLCERSSGQRQAAGRGEVGEAGGGRGRRLEWAAVETTNEERSTEKVRDRRWLFKLCMHVYPTQRSMHSRNAGASAHIAAAAKACMRCTRA